MNLGFEQFTKAIILAQGEFDAFLKAKDDEKIKVLEKILPIKEYELISKKIYAKKIGEDGCLFKLGCQGPVTSSDCVKSEGDFDRFNCIKSGHPCIGCGSENFPRKIMF